MPINYGPDPEPEAVHLDGRPYWGNGRAPGSVRQRRRRAIAMLNTLARMLYEGERFEWAEAGTSSWLANVREVNDIMFGITVDRSVFWRRFAELQEEHRWEL
jgi:hypothetical protein